MGSVTKDRNGDGPPSVGQSKLGVALAALSGKAKIDATALAYVLGRADGHEETTAGRTAGSAAAYLGLRQPIDWRKSFSNAIRKNREECASLEAKLQALDGSKNARVGRLAVLEELRSFLDSRRFALSKPDGSALHKLAGSLAGDKVFLLPPDNEAPERTDRWFSDDVQDFLIEHDWAAAFSKSDFAGEWKPPFERTWFELVIDGKRVCALVDSESGENYIFLYVLVKGVWVYFTGGRVDELPKRDGDREDGLHRFVGDQIRCVCVALDAEVAQGAVTRAPHKLNVQRIKAGKIPLFDYHIVSLSRRSRAPELPATGDEPSHRKRLHWRRGHWRHFENHKTWIKWMLVGNPDLGFIDKHYRV